jgi:4-amino-4-deoxy-L-arabinose transferase-like glycosyltransferase
MNQTAIRPGLVLGLVAAAWVVLIALSFTLRPVLPIVETRYLGVAWEMHLSGDWLVPTLNGAPYSHKPPLLFWLINLGWKAFGVTEIWGRLVAPLFGLGSLALTAVLARQLCPQVTAGRDGTATAATATIILFGAATWMYMASLVYFDLLVTFFAVLGALGLVRAARGQKVSGFALFGIGIGFGVLSKGPVILVHLLPLALFAPLWAGDPVWRGGASANWRHWYAGVLSGIALGAAIALAWAIPAAAAGGETFAKEIFWTQSAGRMVDSFAVRQPVWFYLQLLPVVLFPWVFWPPAWRALGALRHGVEPAARFCLLWFVAGFVILSLISGKQQHYLLPLLPGLALLLARQIGKPGMRITSRDQALPAAVILVAGTLLAIAPAVLRAAPELQQLWKRLPWFIHIPELMGLSLIAAAILVLILGQKNTASRAVPLLALLPATLFAVAHLFIFTSPTFVTPMIVHPAAEFLRSQEIAGHPIAVVGVYNDEYHFLGRLEYPIAEIRPGGSLEWLEQNPQGVVVTRTREWPVETPTPLFTQSLRGRKLAVWEAPTVLASPQAFGLR